MYILKSIATGAAFVFVAFFLYSVTLTVISYRRHSAFGVGQKAIGAGAWYAWTVQSPLFWVVMGSAFVAGMYLMMKFSAPPLYR